MGKLHEPEYDLLLGKRTYDIFSVYWPNNQNNPLGAKFQRINKYVLTHSDEPLTGREAADSPATRPRRLPSSRTDGRDLLLQGAAPSICRCLRWG